MNSKELLKGTLSAIILTLLAEEGRMYGYQISQRVKERSGEQIWIREGSLYPALHKLEAEGAITVETEVVDNRVRRYYSLTPDGLRLKSAKLLEISSFIETLESVLFHKSPAPSL